MEIERLVIDVCEKYIPSIADGSLKDPRVEVMIADGLKYIADTDEKFDIIALDLTDPIDDGPAAKLYEEPFYNDVKNALNPGGVVSAHCSSLVIQPEEAKMLIPRLKRVFGEVVLHPAVVPTYQLTSFGFLIARPEPIVLSESNIKAGFDNIKGANKYLSPEMYAASSVIPPYLAKLINLKCEEAIDTV